MKHMLFFVQCILVLIYQPPIQTATLSSYYKCHPGLVWDNCMDPVPARSMNCAFLCSLSDECLGFNFQKGINSTKPCQLCPSNATKSVTPVASASSPSLYFRFNTVTYKPPGSLDYAVDLPNGLYDGQTIFLRTKPENGQRLAISFYVDHMWSGSIAPEVDFTVDAMFDIGLRPHTIAMDNFDSSRNVWAGPLVKLPVSQFLVDGMDTYTVIFVHKLSYTLYIDDKLMYVYHRHQRKALKEVNLIGIIGPYPFTSTMA